MLQIPTSRVYSKKFPFHLSRLLPISNISCQNYSMHIKRWKKPAAQMTEDTAQSSAPCLLYIFLSSLPSVPSKLPCPLTVTQHLNLFNQPLEKVHTRCFQASGIKIMLKSTSLYISLSICPKSKPGSKGMCICHADNYCHNAL